MMQRPLLQRLLQREAAEAILQSFAPLYTGGAVALLSAEGRLYAGAFPPSRDLSPASDQQNAIIARIIQEAASPEPVWTGEMFLYPLLVNGLPLGAVAAREPAPALLALQTCLRQLLIQGLEMHAIGRETLKRYQEVNLLYYIAETIGTSLDPEVIPRLVLSEANRIIRATCGIALISTPENPDGALQASFGDEPSIRCLRELIGRHAPVDHPFDKADILIETEDGSAPITLAMYAPLKLHDNNIGLIAVGRAAAQPVFTSSDKKLLGALTNQARIALENAWLHQQEVQRQRVEEELKIGQRIQRSMLLKALPRIAGWEFAVSYQSANQVGGDFYDIFPLDGEETTQLGVTVADVTGKGVPAALMMALARTVLRSVARPHDSPAETLQRTNDLIMRQSSSGLFLSLFYAVLSAGEGRLCYTNGGHEPPIWFQARRGLSQELDCGRSTLLGMFDAITPRPFEVEMQHGDALILYTDGITEARSAQGEFFAEERLYQAVNRHGRGSAEDILRGVMAAVNGFIHGSPQADDVTLLVLKRL